MNKELLNYVFRLQQCRVIRCLEPHEQCAADAIRSHSVQNASVLATLQENGHVIAPQLKIDSKKGTSLVFKRVGRSRATTFTGLCAEHDYRIFKPIEHNEVDTQNPLHLFLLAYRAVLRELHATMEAAVKTRLAYRKKGDVGLIPLDVPTTEGMESLSTMMSSYDTYEHKLLYDRALLTDDLSAIKHRVLFLPGLAPTVAVNSLFQPAGEERIALNVFPTQDGATAVFSYHESDARHVAPFLDDLPTTNQEADLERISQLIVENCENFVLAPAFVRQLTDEQQRQILDLSLETLYTRKAPPDAPTINLFQKQTKTGPTTKP